MKRLVGNLLAVVLAVVALASGSAAAAWTPGGPDAGLIRTIAASGTSTLYAGVDGMGVYKSSDGGTTWQASSTGLTNTRVQHVAVGTTATTVYAGTRYGGVFKSIDGGATWRASSGIPDSVIVRRVTTTADSRILLASTEGAGVFLSTDGGDTWSTANGGLINLDVNRVVSAGQEFFALTRTGLFKRAPTDTAWAPVGGGLPAGDYTGLTAVVTSRASTIYTMVMGQGIYRSTDGGTSWSNINATGLPSLNGIGSFAFRTADPNTLYTTVEGYGMYKSADAGASWAAINTGLGEMSVRTYTMSSATTLFAGTVNGIYRSTDAGATWSDVSAGLFKSYGRAIVAHPSNASVLFLGASNGVYKSRDGGASWALSRSGMNAPFVQSLAIDPRAPDTLFAGTYFGGVYKSTDGGSTWAASNGGLSSGYMLYNAAALAIDPSNPSVVYLGFDGFGLYRSSNGGASWSDANAGLHSSRSVWAIHVNRAAPATVLAGLRGGGIYRSTDGGVNWAPTSLNSGNVYSIVADPADPNTVYGAVSGVGVYKSTDAGATWSRLPTTGLTYSRVFALAVDPADPSVLYLGTNNSTAGGVYRSLDGGTTWAAFSDGIDPTLRNISGFAFAGGRIFASSMGGGVFSEAAQSPRTTATNRAPTASNGTALVTGSGALGSLTASDPDGDTLTYRIVTPPAKGNLTLDAATGSFTYAVLAGAAGSDSFTFAATDGRLESNIGTVAVTIGQQTASTSAETLSFNQEQPRYAVGETLAIELVENQQMASGNVDLWLAVQMPDGTLLFATDANGLAFGTSPAAFKRSLVRSVETTRVLDLTVPPGMGGLYTLYAVYVAAGSDVSNAANWRSNLAKATFELAN